MTELIYGQIPAAVRPVTLTSTVTRGLGVAASLLLINSISMGGFRTFAPLRTPILTVAGNVPTGGVTIKLGALKALAEKVPLPASFTLSAAPQAMLSTVGVTVNGVTTAVPTAPLTPSIMAVSSRVPKLSFTMMLAFPQSFTVATKFPPFL